MNPEASTVAPTPEDPFGAPSADDDEFSVDLAGAGAIPVGEYTLQLVGLEKTTSNAGNNMWKWTYQVAEGPFAGRELPTYTALTPNAMWKVAETLEAHGIRPKPGEQLAAFQKSQVIGTFVLGVIEEQEFEGRSRASIATLKPHPKGIRAGLTPV